MLRTSWLTLLSHNTVKMKKIQSIYGIRKDEITCVLLLIMYIMVCCSCGYTFSGSGDLPKDTESLYIEILKNNSSETRLESVFSNDLVDEFTRRDKSLLKTKGEASACLTGTIETVSVSTVSHSDSNSSYQRRVFVVVSMKLISKNNSEIIWEHKQISDSEAYDVDQGNRFDTDRNRRMALERISERFSENVYKLLTEDF